MKKLFVVVDIIRNRNSYDFNKKTIE